MTWKALLAKVAIALLVVVFACTVFFTGFANDAHAWYVKMGYTPTYSSYHATSYYPTSYYYYPTYSYPSSYYYGDYGGAGVYGSYAGFGRSGHYAVSGGYQSGYYGDYGYIGVSSYSPSSFFSIRIGF